MYSVTNACIQQTGLYLLGWKMKIDYKQFNPVNKLIKSLLLALEEIIWGCFFLFSVSDQVVWFL